LKAVTDCCREVPVLTCFSLSLEIGGFCGHEGYPVLRKCPVLIPNTEEERDKRHAGLISPHGLRELCRESPTPVWSRGFPVIAFVPEVTPEFEAGREAISISISGCLTTVLASRSEDAAASVDRLQPLRSLIGQSRFLTTRLMRLSGCG